MKAANTSEEIDEAKADVTTAHWAERMFDTWLQVRRRPDVSMPRGQYEECRGFIPCKNGCSRCRAVRPDRALPCTNHSPSISRRQRCGSFVAVGIKLCIFWPTTGRWVPSKGSLCPYPAGMPEAAVQEHGDMATGEDESSECNRGRSAGATGTAAWTGLDASTSGAVLPLTRPPRWAPSSVLVHSVPPGQLCPAVGRAEQSVRTRPRPWTLLV